MKNMDRVFAVASKEWQLNLRFPVQYFVGNIISPAKSAILMLLIYHGFLSDGATSLGSVHKGNFTVFVLLGTTCHSLFSSCVGVFSDKLITEKWWCTVVATLVSPASAMEVVAGFMIGSGGVYVVTGLAFLIGITLMFPVPFGTFLIAIGLVLMLAFLGFGIGLFGATIRLCFEGYSFFFDYGMQALIFFSCFYYPIELIPKFLRWAVTPLPTYQMAHLLHQLYMGGFQSGMVVPLAGLATLTVMTLWLPAMFLDYSIRKYGIVGY